MKHLKQTNRNNLKPCQNMKNKDITGKELTPFPLASVFNISNMTPNEQHISMLPLVLRYIRSILVNPG